MASTTMLNLYSSWDKSKDHVSLDEDESVSLSSYRRLPACDQRNFAIQAANAGIVTPPKIKKQYAVEISKACYSHGTGSSAVKAMKDISLKVPVGEIYGLLGPSGCGKTTMLRCLVGRLKLDSGCMKVFGEEIGSSCGTLGPRVGYMPQEIALFPDFTIEETLRYFARLFNMSHKAIEERIAFLLDFLELPEPTRLVGSLSGGQKRRVSLAVSLIHSPPLLILDEPTVGVDPVLRQSIWNYLVLLTKQNNLTVIITTHYIEEARSANVVGLMRFGRLLCEASPEYLLNRYQMNTLEEVFLKLCQLDAYRQSFKLKDRPTGQSLKLPTRKVFDKSTVTPPSPQDINGNSSFSLHEIDPNAPDICSVVTHTPVKTPAKRVGNDSVEPLVVSPESTPHSLAGDVLGRSKREEAHDDEDKSHFSSLVSATDTPWISRTFCKTSALFAKNLIRLRRNLPVLLFQFLLPSIEVIIFCICIGRDPFNIPIAIYNEEAILGTGNFSNWFLGKLDNRTIVQVPHPSMESALESVKHGKAWGAMSFGGNFTEALQLRVMLAGGADNVTIDSSNVQVYLDMTNQIIGYQLQRSILYAWRDFSADVSSSMGQNPDAFEFPIQFGTPVYGGHSPSFTEFMAPGVLLSISFLAAVALTALAFVMERKEGLLERSLVAGVTSLEFLMSHVLTQLLVLTVQICLLLIFTFCVFHISSDGPFVWVVILTALQGACGMSYGLMISAICKEENSATMLALGSFYPNLLLSGTVWPVQAMPKFMKIFSYFLPQTIPIESMRYILSRGWDPSYPEVANGFLVTIAWTIFFLVSAVIIFQWKK